MSSPGPIAPPEVPSPDAITLEEFTALLDEYPSVIDKMSKAKGTKSGQKSLQQLDEYRYGQAIADFGSSAAKEMTLDDLRLLVEWKLRHGKFRPMLLGLAASNNATVARRTIAAAMQTYRASTSSDASVAAALAALAKLRGIGPATASLLLSVHDPARVVFFSDEAFYWLCADGSPAAARRKLKYTSAEYAMLRRNAASLMGRLRVGATDVEKVAYVLMRREGADGAAEEAEKDAKATARTAHKAAKAAKVEEARTAKAAKKEKRAKSKTAAKVSGKEQTQGAKTVRQPPAQTKRTAAQEDEPTSGTRRSKRVKR
ncbi:hypothetical protein A9K55_002823 [Cordyceps militaris]|uniref:Uncharacterized protein n=1 Tax=Cordyceps militaris TaxID=73501 RepID=A0A2H4S6K3_CORMI|nr:hypothetical protein A9K55_002823 [Cordyceps militaris]